MQHLTFCRTAPDLFLYADGLAPDEDYSLHLKSVPANQWPLLWRRLSVVLKKEGVLSPRFATTAYPSR